jgi:hypothetical protein
MPTRGLVATDVSKEHTLTISGRLLDGVWIGWLDLLTPYTHHSELQAIRAQPLIFSLYNSLLQSVIVSTIRFLAIDFNTGTITDSLSYTFQISRYCSTHKIFSSQPGSHLHWTSLNNSYAPVPQFSTSTPGRLASRNSSDSLPFLLNHLRLLSQETPSILMLACL